MGGLARSGRLGGRGGFTLVEALVAAVITAQAALALTLLFTRLAVTQGALARELPLRMTPSYLLRRFLPSVQAATCAQIPFVGDSLLLLSEGRDCEGTPLGGPERFAIFCLSAQRRVLYAEGDWSALYFAGRPTPEGQQALACDPAYADWRILTPPGVEARGLFQVGSGGRNLVTLSVELRLRRAPPDSPAIPVVATAAYQGAA